MQTKLELESLMIFFHLDEDNKFKLYTSLPH